MKIMKISAALLAALMFASCGTSTTETTAPSTTEETVTDTKVEIKFEVPDKNMQRTAYWFDANRNFSHDGADNYYIDMEQVSMADYYDAVNNNVDLAAFDSCSKFLINNYSFDPIVDECDYVWMQEHVYDEGKGIKCDLPHIELGSEDCEEVNQRIIDLENFYAMFRDGQFPEYSLKHIEREDGSKTVVFYHGAQDYYSAEANYGEYYIRVYNFDKDGNLMTNEQVWESAGYDPDDFRKKAEDLLGRDLRNASVYWAPWLEIFYESSAKDLDYKLQTYINEEGAVILVIWFAQLVPVGEGYYIPYAIEPDLKMSDSIDHETDISEYEKYVEDGEDVASFIETGILPDGIPYKAVPADSIDKTTVPFDLSWYSQGIDIVGNVRGEGLFGRGCEFALKLPVLCREDGDYKFEYYIDGEIVDSHTVHMTAEPYYMYIDDAFDPGIDCDLLVLVYDKDSDDQVIGAGWLHYTVKNLDEWDD